jgi:hypothetical protein
MTIRKDTPKYSSEIATYLVLAMEDKTQSKNQNKNNKNVSKWKVS